MGKSAAEDPIESTEKLADLLAKEMQANTKLAAEFIAGADKGKFTCSQRCREIFWEPCQLMRCEHTLQAFGKPPYIRTQDATIQIGGAAELNQPYPFRSTGHDLISCLLVIGPTQQSNRTHRAG
jgi:hypothetical protein